MYTNWGTDGLFVSDIRVSVRANIFEDFHERRGKALLIERDTTSPMRANDNSIFGSAELKL
jgi:hypothetical protein